MSDYIKRDDAEQIMYSYGIGGTMFVDDLLKPSESEEARQKEVWEMVRKVLDRVAVKDVAPVRHGMWVDVDRMQMHDLHGILTWGNSFMCTECNFKTFAVEGHMAQYRYCPCCGARMDGEEKNCDTCKHYDKWWDDIICDGCTKAYSNWERKDDE